MGSSGEAGINAEPGVGLVHPGERTAVAPKAVKPPPPSRDGTAEGGERAGGLVEDEDLYCSIEQVRDGRI